MSIALAIRSLFPKRSRWWIGGGEGDLEGGEGDLGGREGDLEGRPLKLCPLYPFLVLPAVRFFTFTKDIHCYKNRE